MAEFHGSSAIGALYSFVFLTIYNTAACRNDNFQPTKGVDRADLIDASVEKSRGRWHFSAPEIFPALDAGTESRERSVVATSTPGDAAVDGSLLEHAEVVRCELDAGKAPRRDDASAPSTMVIKTGKIFSLGNSFTGGAVIESLAGDSKWDIYCGSTLDFILHNPEGSCAAQSIPWTSVLDNDNPTIFDAIIFQPTPGDLVTLATDTAAISYWMARQPLQTAAVLQASWPLLPGWEDTFHGTFKPPGLSNRSLEYIERLTAELRLRNPGRRIVYTRSNEMMDFIYHDSTAPFAFADLFRDESAHPTEIASYLHHNALRQSLGQPVPSYPADRIVADNIRKYLDTVVLAFPPQE